MWLSPIEINGLDIELPNGEAKVKTERKDQATLIAELISRVTSLEDAVEFILEQSQINTVENTNEIQSKGEAMNKDTVILLIDSILMAFAVGMWIGTLIH